MEPLYYTYIHLNKDEKPIYVGKGKGNRAYEKRTYNEEYTVKIVQSNLTEELALELEEFLISEIGIDNLYNKFKKGCISGNQLKINYSNFNEEVKRISKCNAKLLVKYINIIIDDACNGNNVALKFIIKKAPLSFINEIKYLLNKNTEVLEML